MGQFLVYGLRILYVLYQYIIISVPINFYLHLVYLSCGGFLCAINFGDCGWWGFGFFFVFIVGLLYVILWIIDKLANCGVPDPVPLDICCGGKSKGYSRT